GLPTDPDVPIDPVEPINPDAPIDPVEPTNPDDNLEDPSDPGLPTDPDVPIDPVEPINPDAPIDPVEPINPDDNLEDPSAPGLPTGPDVPIGPVEPTNPDEPNLEDPFDEPDCDSLSHPEPSGERPVDLLIDECFERHNMYRFRHTDNLLSWDHMLQNSAQLYAEQLAQTEEFEHSEQPGIGENLYFAFNSGGVTREGSCNRALDLWYDEIENYDFGSGTSLNGKVIGHFTQMVWMTTTKIGIGMAINGDGTKIYVVAQYSPPGNFIGQYTEQVKPLRCAIPRPAGDIEK
uniref:SCP domain-containing protein n=2 Tax=Clytia hemisphaerica TaxID=252671 RepID=A0A7M5X626_9CNID